MQSLEIVLLAGVSIVIGAAALRYHLTGRRRFELLIIGFGVATVASGVAILRDGVAGSREILWMVPAERTVADQTHNRIAEASLPTRAAD